ncbi:MAG: biopolymer transporter ExbD [Clostridia bacterium]|nr:biopolymer transporter ExbD [Deltaproteobacteria bacterium]
MSDNQRGIGQGLFGKESGAVYEVYLNLTPLMDVMSNLLFFLLASFGATMVAVIPNTVPTVSSGEPSPNDDKPEESVNVTLRLDGSGITIKCESDTVPRDVLNALGAKIAKKDNAYDYKSVTVALKAIKEKYRASSNVVVVPDDDLPYATIVKVLDAARDTRLVDTRNAILFPNVVLSGIATHDIDGNPLK